MKTLEIWKDIDNYEGCYQVSNNGRVKSLPRNVTSKGGSVRHVKERILKTCLNRGKYSILSLYKNEKPKTRTVHQLVAEAFLNHKPCGMRLVINHINFNKLDNRVDNIEIITSRENTNKKHLKSSSKYVGVSRDKSCKKWTARITINGKHVNLGRFINELDASNAYQNKLKTL